MSLLPVSTQTFYLRGQWFSEEGLNIPLHAEEHTIVVTIENGYLTNVNHVLEARLVNINAERQTVGLWYSERYVINGWLFRMKESITPWSDIHIKTLSFVVPISQNIKEPFELVFENQVFKNIKCRPLTCGYKYQGFQTTSQILNFELELNGCDIETAQEIQVKLNNLLLLGFSLCGTPMYTIYTTTEGEKIYQYGAPQMWSRQTCHFAADELDRALKELITAFPRWVQNHHLSLWRDVVKTVGLYSPQDMTRTVPRAIVPRNNKEGFDIVFDFFECVLRTMSSDRRVVNITAYFQQLDNCGSHTQELINKTIPIDVANKMLELFPLDDRKKNASISKYNEFLRTLAILRNKSHHTYLKDEVQCEQSGKLSTYEVHALTQHLLHISWAICLHEILGLNSCWSISLTYETKSKNI